MTTSSRIREHLRTNLVSYVALFCFAIGGTASALPGKGTVESNDIKKDAVKRKQVKETTLDFGVVQKRVGGECDADEALKAVGENGSVECGDVGGATPTGPAGNGLAGTYPNPSIAPNSVGATQLQTNAVIGGGGGDLMDNTISTEDVNDSGGGTLVGADVNESQLDLQGRSAIDSNGNCDDNSGACAVQDLTTTRSARVLLIGNSTAFATALNDLLDVFDDPGLVAGTCFFIIDGAGQNPRSVEMFNQGQSGGVGGTMVSGVLSAAPHTFVWACSEDDGDMTFVNSSISVVLLSAT